jgi:hypothetical protein
MADEMKVVDNRSIESIERLQYEVEKMGSKLSDEIRDMSDSMSDSYSKMFDQNREMIGKLSTVIEGLKVQIEQANTLLEKTDNVRREVEKGTEVAANSFILQTAGKLFTQLGLIKSQDNRIEQQFFKAINRIVKINQKFDKLNTEIEDSYKIDVKRVGKHILTIEEQFKIKVEKRLRSFHTNFFQSVKSSMEEIAGIRKTLVERNFSTASEKVNGFIQQRKQFHDAVSKIRIDEVKTPNQTFAIPVTVAISKTDSNYQKVYVGSEMQDIIDPFIKFRLEDQDWFNTYRDVSMNYEASIDWRDMTEYEKNEILEELNVLKQEGFINEEFTKAFQDALSLHPPRVPQSVRDLVINNE